MQFAMEHDKEGLLFLDLLIEKKTKITPETCSFIKRQVLNNIFSRDLAICDILKYTTLFTLHEIYVPLFHEKIPGM